MVNTFARESVNDVLKQRTQWWLMNLPDLIYKLQALVSAEYKEADRALLGVGDISLRPVYSKF